MIQALANRVAEFVVNNDDTADYEVLAYGYGLIVWGIFNYTIIIASAAFLGVICEMFAAIAVYITMRSTIGGVHASNRAICLATYAGILYFSIFISPILNLSVIAIAALFLTNVILLILYAPSDTAEQPIVKRRLLRKILGILILTAFFSFSIFSDNMQIVANIMLLIPTFTCLFLHPLIYRILGCKKSI